MDARERRKLIARAKELETSGLVDGALRLYTEAGELDQGARVLVGARRFAEAGNLLVGNLGLPRGSTFSERDIAGLSPEMKRRALHAAICFSRAGERDLAVRMFLALGESSRAIELLEQAGDRLGAAKLRADYRRRGTFEDGERATGQIEAVAEVTSDGAKRLEAAGNFERAMEAYARLRQPANAARMARMLDNPRQAAELFGSAGMSYEAALCWLECGDTGKAIDNFVRVPRTDPRYRESALQAIALSSSTGVLDFALENFLSRFLDDAPRDVREVEALDQLARLYIRHDFVENAQSVLSKVLSADPNNIQAKQILGELAKEGRGSELVYRKILDEDLDFNQSKKRRRKRSPSANLGELPGLPDLPGLPGLPDPPVAYSRDHRGVSTAPPAAKPGDVREDSGTEPAAVPQTLEKNMPTGGYAPTEKFDAMLSDPRRAVVDYQEPARPQATESELRGIPGVEGRRRSPPPSPRAPRATSSDDIPSVEDIQMPHETNNPMPPVGVKTSASVDPLARFDSVPAVGQSDGVDSLGEPPPADFEGFEVGMVVNGRYRFDAKIGQGGMAAVYRAFDLELEEDIAIKIFNRPLSEEGAVKRFKQELLLSRKLMHPNIIRLYDIGSCYGYRFISMELLRGKDLYAHVNEPQPIDLGLDYLIQTCRGLQSAHDAGVIHRDIKPHNIFVCEDGRIKVMDFGIAKQQHTPGMTVGNMIAGTPEYMSPEQISGFSSVSSSTDLYALGIVAYQVFTAKVPFAHTEMLPLLMMHINERPMPPRELREDIPPELERIILRLLEKRPEDRFGSAAQLAEAFEAVRARL
ncbi:MAG: tetratricopeptide (TPR) repeat protein [Flavobacteriales bacterium]|jgi:tetratricopeptide (TPR) repeat protein